jgi:hypothetical protein
MESTQVATAGTRPAQRFIHREQVSDLSRPAFGIGLPIHNQADRVVADKEARVSPHPERQGAGQTGAAACAYVPIPTAEAVSTLGLGRILGEIEAATGVAGQAGVDQAREHAARHERLLRVEQMLGWEQAPVEGAEPLRLQGGVFAMPIRGGGYLTTGVVVLGVVMAVLFLNLGMPGAFLPLALAVPTLLFRLRGGKG